MSKSVEIGDECPMNIAFNVLDGKYKLKILWHLSKGPIRFNELQKLMGDVTQKTLTMQLRQLEEDQLIYRKVYAEIPPRVEYGLTPIGESMKQVLGVMCEWGKEYSKRIQYNR